MQKIIESSPIRGISKKTPEEYTNEELVTLWKEITRNRDYRGLTELYQQGEGSNETEEIILELHTELTKRGFDPLAT